jgi:hypothetical protein
MIILDTTNKSLEVKLAGAVSSAQLPIVASYVDIASASYSPASIDGQTNDTNAVTVVSAPGSSVKRQVKLVTVHNADDAQAVVILQYKNGATARELVRVTLDGDDTLIYTDGEGFRVLSAAGQIKGVGATGPTGPQGPEGPQGPPGTTDHGLLTGLADDDHPQYHTDTRALAWLNARSIADLATKTHALLSALTADDHTQYALLVGRSGGQTLKGGTASGNKLTLESTNDATKGDIDLISAEITHLSTARHRMAGQNRFRHLNSICKLFLTAEQTIPDSVWTTVAFGSGSENIDTDGLHDEVTNPSRITIALTGKYLVEAGVRFFTGGTGNNNRALSFLLNGTTRVELDVIPPPVPTIANTFCSGVAIIGLSAGDYIEMQAYQASGGNLNIMILNNFTRFGACYLGE